MSYTWDVGSSLPEILNDNMQTYVYGLDLTSATDSAGNQNYYMHNGVGSVSMIADYSGGLKAEYYYSEFGLPSYSYENGVSNDRRFSGEQQDADSGMYYLRARYYDPGTGRFLSQDPVAGGADKPQSQNAYPYVTNNPVNLADPSGMSADFGWDFLGIASPTCGLGEAKCWFDYVNDVLYPALRDFLDAAWSALKKTGAFLDNFITPECGIAAVGALGFWIGGPTGFALSAAGALAIGGAAGGVRGGAAGSADSGNDVAFAWLRKYMQANKAWGAVTAGGGDMVVVNTARNLQAVGGTALLTYAAFQCVRSGLD
jgi:RHS repeat-associated protein